MDGASRDGGVSGAPIAGAVPRPDLRIAELEAHLRCAGSEIEELRGEIDELRGRLRTTESQPSGRPPAVLESPDPVLVVDGDGAVVATSGPWPWGEPGPVVGAPLLDLFAADSAETLAELAASGWLGASERTFELRDGRWVSLTVRAAFDGLHRVAVHDVTAKHVLDDANGHRRRMRALAELAGSLARELTDPMSIVQGRMELLLELGVTDPAMVRRHLDVALEHARRVTATLRNLRLVGWTPAARPDPVRIDAVVEEALDLLGPRRDRVLVKIEPADLLCGGDGPLATRVLASLLRQSLESSGRGAVHLRAKKKQGQVTIRIGPSGRPLPPGAHGAGGELPDGEESALDRTLIASIGGEFGARRSTHGLQFEVTLPSAPTRRSRRRPLRGRIAVVGSLALHEAVTGLLVHDGYEFLCARTGEEGLVAVANAAHAGAGNGVEGARHAVDAVVTELLLDGGLSGLTLAEALIRRHPGLEGRVLLVSEGPVIGVRAPVVPMTWPLGRGELLEALGHRVRR